MPPLIPSVWPTDVFELQPELPLVPELLFVPFVTLLFVLEPLVWVFVWLVVLPDVEVSEVELLTPEVCDSPWLTLLLPEVPLDSVVLNVSLWLFAVDLVTDSDCETELATLWLSEWFVLFEWLVPVVWLSDKLCEDDSEPPDEVPCDIPLLIPFEWEAFVPNDSIVLVPWAVPWLVPSDWPTDLPSDLPIDWPTVSPIECPTESETDEEILWPTVSVTVSASVYEWFHPWLAPKFAIYIIGIDSEKFILVLPCNCLFHLVISLAVCESQRSRCSDLTGEEIIWSTYSLSDIPAMYSSVVSWESALTFLPPMPLSPTSTPPDFAFGIPRTTVIWSIVYIFSCNHSSSS